MKLTFHSDYCDRHNKPVQMMIINGSVICPRCKLDEDNARLQSELQEHFDSVAKREQYNTLENKSLLDDETLADARMDNFAAAEVEEKTNKQIMFECIRRYKAGEKFNTILQGKPGSGKSHLSYAALWELNETKDHSCLFISVESMLRKIKDSFNNKQSKYTESYFVELLSNVDFLVLDDLGAETGAVDTDKQATDFVQRILYAVANVRQNKATIITTNLSGKALTTMYDSKLVSRLLRNPKYIIFKDTKDKRTSNIPF